MTNAPSGSPILCRALSWLDCVVVRHIDLESDCGLYVGEVRAGGTDTAARRASRLGHTVLTVTGGAIAARAGVL